MSRRIRTLAIRTAPVLAGLILAQATSAAADTAPPAKPGQVQTQAQAPAQPQVQPRQGLQTYRRMGVTPPPISAMTLPAIGPSNYTVSHHQPTYWGTVDRNPDPQLYPKLPTIGQPAQAPPPVNTASVFRYLPPSTTQTTAAYGNSPFGPPQPPVNAQP